MKSPIQSFFENCFYSILSFLKILIQSRRGTRIKWEEYKSGDDIIILGNGPSLTRFLASGYLTRNNTDTLCVNFFARTEEYQKVKPKFYVITSPEYFVGEEKESWRQDRNLTFTKIAEDTNWQMALLVPVLARKNRVWDKEIRKNQKVTISYFNTTPIEGFKSLNYFWYGLRLGMPRPHNVLIPSIFIALHAKYKRIFLVGADHNWTREMMVTNDNRVLLSQKHFYDDQQDNSENKNSSTPKPMYKGGSGEERKIHEVLTKFVYAFQAYWEIKEYVEKRKASEIINITPGSFIDAFKKEKLYD